MDETLLEWLQEQDVENTTLAKLLTKYYYTWQKYSHEVSDLLSRGTKIRCSDCTLEGDK